MPEHRSMSDPAKARGVVSNLPPLYHVTTALCIFMVAWILIFPASAFHEGWRRDLFARVVPSDGPVAPETVTKYAGHSLVHATHILPGALWSVLIPIQLHPKIRRKYRTLHRWSGYVFAATALVMAYGVWLILDRQLGFEHMFHDLPPLDGLGPTPLLFLMTAYFVATLVFSVYSARNGRMMSGLWIAVQRILLNTIFVVASYSRAEQRQNFIVSAHIAILISGVAGEYAVYKLRQEYVERPKDKVN